MFKSERKLNELATLKIEIASAMEKLAKKMLSIINPHEEYAAMDIVVEV